MNPFESPLYLQKYGLKEPPYSMNPDERYLYLSESHLEAINMCGSIIMNKQGCGLVVGEQGTGKTTIMRRLSSLMSSNENYHVAIVETAGHVSSPFQLVKEILESFGQECKGQDTLTRNTQFKEFLASNIKEGKTTVLLIDEAQQMNKHHFEALRGYLNFEFNGGKAIQIILFAMPNINVRMKHSSLRTRLMRTVLGDMSRKDMEDMLRWRFSQAGGGLFPFEESSLDELFKLTKGKPRLVCGMAQLALELSAARNQFITDETVKEVSQKMYL